MTLSAGTCTPALPVGYHSRIICSKRLKFGQNCQQSNLLFNNLHPTATSKFVKELNDSTVSLSQHLQHLALDQTSQAAQKTLRYSFLCRKDECEAGKQAKRTNQSGNWHQQAGGKQKGWLGSWQQFAAAGGSVVSPHQEPENSPPWRNLLPQPLLYTSSLDDIDPVQVSELWSLTLREDREPLKVARAMRHSFAFILVRDPAGVNACGTAGRTVGIGRAISDGVFVATICDVAVHPEYQRRGIGRKIVKKLMQEIRGKGPTGFAVFPPPITRRFFWMMGFRSDKKYKIMAYNGTMVEDSTSGISSQLVSPFGEEADAVLNVEATSSSAREEDIDCTPNLNLEVMKHHNNAHASESQESQQKTKSQQRETVASPQLECNDRKTTSSLNVEDGVIEIGPHVYRTQMSDTRERERSAVAMEASTLSEDHINVMVSGIEGEGSCAKVIRGGIKDEDFSSELKSPNIFYEAGV